MYFVFYIFILFDLICYLVVVMLGSQLFQYVQFCLCVENYFSFFKMYQSTNVVKGKVVEVTLIQQVIK